MPHLSPTVTADQCLRNAVLVSSPVVTANQCACAEMPHLSPVLTADQCRCNASLVCRSNSWSSMRMRRNAALVSSSKADHCRVNAATCFSSLSLSVSCMICWKLAPKKCVNMLFFVSFCQLVAPIWLSSVIFIRVLIMNCEPMKYI